MRIINQFENEYAFLSNFYEKPFIYEGVEYKTAEHAFQAVKCVNKIEANQIREAATPGQAKRLGRICRLRSDWEDVKVDLMTDIVRAKFQDPELQAMLLATDDAILIEGNWWHDNCWGNCSCDRCSSIKGKNNLGKILMQLREDFKHCTP